MFETMVVELEELIARLTRINDKMMDYTHNLGELSYCFPADWLIAWLEVAMIVDRFC